MDYKNNRVIKILGIKYPLIQAPMMWVTNSKLVSSVSNAGGLGVLGPNAGYDTVTTCIKTTAERMRNEIKNTKKLTANPFAVNILLPYKNSENTLKYTEKILEVCFEEDIKYFVISGDIKESYFKKIKKYKGVILYRPLTPTTVVMKKAESLGADILVATGYDEGGLLPNNSIGTFTIVPTIVDAVNIPVLAAGGINDRRGVKAAFDLGAEGVFVGSRFIITKESPASEVVKNKIIKSDIEEMIEINRNFRTLTTKNIKEMLKSNSNSLNLNFSAMSALRIGFLSDTNFEDGVISINTGINIIKDIPSIDELIKRLMED